jgi:LmbE family N-acetylglucosaminyl deacetylase
MPKTIAVVAAHPDDEVLGCGGTIAKHAREGDVVHVLLAGEGLTSRDTRQSRAKRQSALTRLGQSARRANAILGVRTVDFLHYPDNRMDSLDRLVIIKAVEGFLRRHAPEIVYTHHAGDVNIDHRIVHEAIVTACRPVPFYPTQTVLFFEVASSTEWQTPGSAPSFTPNWFNDISETWSLKLKALQAYGDEMRPWPHARSLRALEHLARWRGAAVGLNAAEAFMTGRHIIGGKKS